MGANEVRAWGGAVHSIPFEHERSTTQPAGEDPPMNDRAVEGLVDRLKAIVGERGIVTSAEHAQYVDDWRGYYHGRAAAVVKPASTEEVARVVQLLSAERVAMVPQGGNTSLCGGSVPDASARRS